RWGKPGWRCSRYRRPPPRRSPCRCRWCPPRRPPNCRSAYRLPVEQTVPWSITSLVALPLPTAHCPLLRRRGAVLQRLDDQPHVLAGPLGDIQLGEVGGHEGVDIDTD